MLEETAQLFKIVFTFKPRKKLKDRVKQTGTLVHEPPENDGEVEKEGHSGQNERHPLVITNLMLLSE